MGFAFIGSTFSSGGGCFFAFTPSKKFFTSACTIFVFSSRLLSYGNFSGVFREGPNLYVLPPLVVLLDTDRADGAVVFFTCLRGGGEGLRRAGAAGARQVSSALADEAKEEAGCSGASAQAEKEAECRHVPEKEPAEGPDRHSPEEEAVEAECPDSPEEEEAVASSSEG